MATSWKKSPPELVALFESVMPGPPAQGKQMFGYPAAFVGGNMFMGLHQESFLVRLPEGPRAALLALPGAKTFEPMAGRPMREYIILPPPVLADRRELQRWVAAAFDYGKSLKPKDKSAPKAKGRR